MIVENTHARLEEVVSIDISTTMLALASFIARFDTPAIFRIKIKFCALCDSVCERTDTLTFRKDSGARRSILDIIMEWIHAQNVRVRSRPFIFHALISSSHSLISQMLLRTSSISPVSVLA